MSCIGPLMLLTSLMLILIMATSPSQSNREEEVGAWLPRPGHVKSLFILQKRGQKIGVKGHPRPTLPPTKFCSSSVGHLLLQCRRSSSSCVGAYPSHPSAYNEFSGGACFDRRRSQRYAGRKRAAGKSPGRDRKEEEVF